MPPDQYRLVAIKKCRDDSACDKKANNSRERTIVLLTGHKGLHGFLYGEGGAEAHDDDMLEAESQVLGPNQNPAGIVIVGLVSIDKAIS